MKPIQSLLSIAILIFALSTSIAAQDQNVNLISLANKDFKYIAKFDRETTIEDIDETVKFLKRYDKSLIIKREVDKENQNISFEISSGVGSCKSSDFGMAMVLINEKNEVECAMGDKDAKIDPRW